MTPTSLQHILCHYYDNIRKINVNAIYIIIQMAKILSDSDLYLSPSYKY